jgi:hypothetical protein
MAQMYDAAAWGRQVFCTHTDDWVPARCGEKLHSWLEEFAFDPGPDASEIFCERKEL